jgi:hypothetical protein
MALVRHRDFGGPSWLWSALELDRKAAGNGAATRHASDRNKFKIELYRRFYELWSGGTETNEALLDEYPSCYDAANIWRDNEVSSFKWIIEAMILAGADSIEIAEELGNVNSAVTVKAYKDLFFDVAENKDKKAWMYKYIWSRSHNNKNSELYYVDMVYKAAGMLGGSTILGGLLIFGAVNNDTRDWIEQFVGSEKDKTTLRYASNYAKLDAGSKMIANEAVTAGWARVKSQTGQGIVPQVVYDRLGTAVSGAMTIMGLNQSLDSKELVNVDMYKDEDIKNE